MYLSHSLDADERRVLIEYAVARIDTSPKLGRLLDRDDETEAKRVWADLSDHLALLDSLGFDLEAGPIVLSVPADFLERLLPVLLTQAHIQRASEEADRSTKTTEWGGTDLLISTGEALAELVDQPGSRSADKQAR